MAGLFAAGPFFELLIREIPAIRERKFSNFHRILVRERIWC